MMQTPEQNIPVLRFPEFSGEWNQDALGSYYTFKNGVNADKAAYGSGYKFINVLDIISDIPITSDRIIGTVDISEQEFKKNEVCYGDILFQRSSETREEVGQSNVYVDAKETATFGGFVIRGKPQKEQDPKFFHYLLKTAKVRQDMTSRSGGSTRYNVGQESLSLVSVNVPPTVSEQIKIAKCFNAIDEKIIQLSRKKELLEEYKKSCMQQIFSQTIRFRDDNGNPYPDWKEKRLEDIAKIKMGSSPPSSAYGGKENGIPLLQGNADLINGYSCPRIYTTEVTQECDIDDILMSVRAPVGEFALSLHKACIGRGIAAIRPINNRYCCISIVFVPTACTVKFRPFRVILSIVLFCD